jgi:anti-sigma B factor antagonist
MTDMHVEFDNDGHGRIDGEIDMATAPVLARALERCDGDVVIDCSSLRFIDAAGIRVLVAAANRLEARDRGLLLVNVSAWVDRVLHAAGVASRVCGRSPTG